MASTSKLLLLRRGDHDSRLTEGFESLLDKESMTDVSITCDQQLLRAHRTVLSIFSPFFRRVFDSITNPMHYPVIVLQNMPYSDLRAIIDLMYRGEVTVTQDQFPSLKKSARVLEVSELSDIISSYEERNDLKFKLDDNISSSGGRSTRKRGRPKRYAEDSDEAEYKPDTEYIAPPTKRQQAMLSNRSSTSGSANKPTLTALLNKPQTATRGGLLARQTAIRGGRSAFSKPQMATRGGVTLSKPQLGSRGGLKGASSSRGRAPRLATEDDDIDFDPSQELVPTRRNKRGRPRKSSVTKEDKGLPMGTNLPISLPQPLEGVDLANIFQNMGDVSSSTTAPPGAPMPQPFAPTIKLEIDSDSEVECIMSGTSPLPSGVMDDGPEITETEITDTREASVDEVSNSNEQITESNIQTTSSVPEEPTTNRRDSVPEVARSEIDPDDSEVNILSTNVVIKSEKPETPVEGVSQTNDETEQPIAPEIRPEDNSDSNTGSRLVTTTQVEQTTTETVSQSTASVSPVASDSANAETSQSTTVPMLRRIKAERVTPPPEDHSSFQPIDNQRQESEAITQSIPVLTRVKSERLSPKTVANDNSEVITINQDSNQESTDTPNVTSSRKDSADAGDVSNTGIIDQSTDQNSRTNSRNGDVSTSSQQSTADSNQQSVQPTAVETTEGQELDVQELAFDCFYSNDDQMQAYGSEANSSSAVTYSASNINSFGFNSQDITTQSNQFIPNSTDFSQIITQTSNTFTPTPTTIITTSEVPQQPMMADSNQQYFAVNTSQPQLTNASNTYSQDNNVVMNSPIHSDEECMLLDSPQQSGTYEVNNALDDSMDNL